MSQASDTGRRIAALALLVVGVGASGVLVLRALTQKPASTGPDPAATRDAIESRVREASAALHARLATLAELPRVAAAVATDSATVRNLTDEELSFRPKPGETLTIAQLAVSKGRTKPGEGQVLLVLPSGGTAVPLVEGRSAAIEGGRLYLREAIGIVPRERSDEVRGLLGATWPVDLADLDNALGSAHASATLASGQQTLKLGAREAAADPVAIESAIDAAGTKMAFTLRAPVSQPDRTPLVVASAVALGSIAAAAGLLRRKRQQADAPLPMSATIAAPAFTPAAPVFSRMTEPAPITADLPAPQAKGTAPRFGSGPGGGVPSAPAEAGQFGRYALTRALGSGGMADVFLAQVRGEAGFQKPVALKILKSELAYYPGAVEHLLDEARLAAQLDHPNIVQVIDLGRSGDNYFIAMEYVDGLDLERLIELGRGRGERAPLDVALAILGHVCAGLHAAHTAVSPTGTPLELVHRDVKSANVLVARNGAVKVADFGIATATPAARQSRTEIGQVKGTPGYMAPEHRLGEAVDRRADVYGVGAIAYELFTGAPINLDLAVLAARGTVGWPHLPRLSQVRPDLPAALDDIITAALAYDRNARPEDCAALGDAFAAVATAGASLASDRAIARWVAGLAAGATQAPAASSAAR